jgi:hypothetical protein
MKRMFEFVCEDGHVFEKLIDDDIRSMKCIHCDTAATRVVSAPRVNLEGITGAFPGAYSRWERVRAEKQQQERKKAASHGE